MSANTKQAVVVGAAGGIGSECARMLLADGWRVFAMDVRHEDILRKLPDGDENLVPLACDITDLASIDRAFAEVRRSAGALHALACCPGILRVGPLDQMPVDAFDSIFAVNVRGPFLCARAALPLLEQGRSPSYAPRIIFLSSTAAVRPPKIHGGAYAATKAALGVLMRAFAGELAPRGILVNAVAPGAVDTDFTRQAHAEPAPGAYKPGGNSSSPLGRTASARDVVAVMRFLLGDDVGNIVGSTITTDGGSSAVRM